MLHPPPSASAHAKPATAPSLFVRRTHSKKTRRLTPQFHWTLNDCALDCLSNAERATLYQLFRFYDSSCNGDALPAVHLRRFLELLRDARLLNNDETDHQELTAETVERVFAQAVLGKLRTYLDADDEPALTFQLFCGALFHCAMLSFPAVSPPEDAFRKLLERLLMPLPQDFSSIESRGLVQHAEQAAIPSWSVQDLYRRLSDGHSESPDEERAFLNRPTFRHVLANLSLDKVADETEQEQLHELYALPEELTNHFNAETIRVVTERFRLFDVLDRGVLPRDEVFALLSGMARTLEITDVYEVLAVILAGEWGDRRQMPRGSLVLSAPSSVTHVSLAQVLNAIYICRRARTASYHPSPQSPGRKLGGVGVEQAKQTSTEADPANGHGGGGETTRKKASAGNHSKGKPSDKRAVRGKPPVASQPHKQQSSSPGKSTLRLHAVASQQAPVTSPTKRAAAGKKDKKATVATTGEAALLRRLSKMSTVSTSEASTHHGSQEIVDETDAAVAHLDSFRSASSTSSSANAVKIPTGMAEVSPPKVTVSARESGPNFPSRPDETNENHDVERPQTSHTMPLAAQPPATLTLRMFYTRDTRPSLENLDGAISLSLALFLLPPPSRIVASQGIHFATNGDRDEIWHRETLRVDGELPLEAAIVALKNLVGEKEHVGFQLVPDLEQREAVETLLQEIRDATCPRYAAALHPTPQNKPQTRPPTEASALLCGSDQKKKKKRLSTHLPHYSTEEALLDPRPASPSISTRRPCGRPRPAIAYDHIVRTLRLDQPQDAWVTALNEPRLRLRTSQSLPTLARPPQTWIRHGAR